MDNILGQILEGIIQGITEFLPISSSGHIVFKKDFGIIFRGFSSTANCIAFRYFDFCVHLLLLRY